MHPIDNTYRGQKAALWIFAVLVLLKVVMSLNSIFNGYAVAAGADGIPLGAFPPAAVRTVVSLFALWGLGHFVLCVLCIFALARYRSLVPFFFTVLLLEHLARKAILYFLPSPRVGVPPAVVVNLVLLALMVGGLALSLWPARAALQQPNPEAVS